MKKEQHTEGDKTQKARAKHVAWAFILRGCFSLLNQSQ